MKQTFRELIQLNQAFYDSKSGRSFSRHRRHPWKGWDACINVISDTSHVLDLGCGNGRFLQFLCEKRPHDRMFYTGVDASLQMIDIASERCQQFHRVHAQFLRGDITSSRIFETLLSLGPFTLIVLCAVLHHIPSMELRLQILKRCAALNTPIGSMLMLSFWSFEKVPRIENKYRSWPDDIARDPGDYLMAWKQGTESEHLRYCHHFSDDDRNMIIEELIALKYEVHASIPPCSADPYNHYVVFKKK